MKLLRLVVVCGLVTVAQADTTDPFTYPHAHPGAMDPFKYMHGLPQPEAYSGLGADSVSAADIARFAPKPLEPTASRRIEAFLDVRGATGGFVTARGDRMFFTWKITGTAQVWRQDGPQKWPVQLTGGEDTTTVVGIAPNDAFVVVSRDVGGAENPGLYVLDPHGGPLRLIQHTPNVQTSLALISDDSKSIYYRANDRDPGSYAIYRFDVGSGTKQLVFDRPGLWAVIDQRGDQWLMQKQLGEVQSEIHQWDLTKQTLTPILGQGEAENYEARFGAKPGQLIVRTDKLGEFARLYTFEGGKLAPIGAAIQHDVEAFAIDATRTRLYYNVNEEGYRRLVALDARTLRPIALPALPSASSVTLAGVTRNARFAQFALDGSIVLPTTYVYDWQTKRLVEWRSPASPEIDVTAFAKAELESYPARDGVEIPMFVRRPAKCVNAACPVIVEFHGGPEGQATPVFSPIEQAFVERGFVIVQPNVRGSSGYGKTWLHADDGPKRLDVITDIEDCAKHIRSTWRVTKIGVSGGSYGGYSVLMAMTLFAGAYDAGVEQVGMSNLTTFLRNTAPYRRPLRISEYGDPVKDKAALEKLSPITYVDRIKAPLLIFGGVNDPRVPVGEPLQIHGAMEQRRIEGDLILFPDEGHGSSKRANIVLTIGHEIAFFEQHLK
ncbi:MAG: prolyl oligopeptidase family serine peptidase [Kofleriaceae bacterium]